METLSKQLLAFRAAYLRGIAKSWIDDDFKKEFVSSKGEAKNVLVNKEFTNLLPEDLGKDWNMDIAIVENNEVSYNPYNTASNNGWHGGADVMVIKIPKKPKNKKGSNAEALAKYYELFPTPFGNNCSDKSPDLLRKVGEIQKLFVPFKYSDYEAIEARLKNISNETGDGGVTSFLTFGNVMMDIVANCWESKSFFEYLIKTPLKPIGQDGSVLKNVFRQYSNEWAFSIVFEEDDDAEWDVKTATWCNLSNNQIYLQYPVKPKENFSEEKALARYNATGPVFPLTCL